MCGLLFRIRGSVAILDDGRARALTSRKGNLLLRSGQSRRMLLVGFIDTWDDNNDI